MAAKDRLEAVTRAATGEDAAFLEVLFRSVHEGEFAASGLAREQVDSLLAMQFHGQRMSYAKDFPGAEDRIVLDARTLAPVGRVLVESRPEAIHLIDVALLPEERGKGIGRGLMEALLERSRATGVPVTLMVRPGNRAFNLYRRLGFAITSAGMQMGMAFRPAGAALQPTSAVTAGGEDGAAEPVYGAEWEAVVGKEFEVAATGEAGLRLRLVSLGRPHAGTFVLLFEGPMEPVLPQAIYELAMLRGAETEVRTLFLVPVGPEGGAMQYEAVFNRG